MAKLAHVLEEDPGSCLRSMNLQHPMSSILFLEAFPVAGKHGALGSVSDCAVSAVT